MLDFTVNKRGTMSTKEIEIKGIDPLLVFGINDNLLKILGETFPIQIFARGNKITLNGSNAQIDLVEI